MDKYRVVADFHGPVYLAKMITGELKAEDNQKLFIIAEGVANFAAFQTLLARLNKFIEEPDKLRFFFTTSAKFDFRVFVLEKVDAIVPNLIRSNEGISFVDGYCLKAMLKTSFSWPTDVMGALYSCPYCGLIDEVHEDSRHVFNPSTPLVEALERRKA